MCKYLHNWAVKLGRQSCQRSGAYPSGFSGHSLRTGLARYVRDGELFIDNAASRLLYNKPMSIRPRQHPAAQSGAPAPSVGWILTLQTAATAIKRLLLVTFCDVHWSRPAKSNVVQLYA